MKIITTAITLGCIAALGQDTNLPTGWSVATNQYTQAFSIRGSDGKLDYTPEIDRGIDYFIPRQLKIFDSYSNAVAQARLDAASNGEGWSATKPEVGLTNNIPDMEKYRSNWLDAESWSAMLGREVKPTNSNQHLVWVTNYPSFSRELDRSN